MPEKWESLVIIKALRHSAVAPIMASGSLRRCLVRNISALDDNSSSCTSGTISTLVQNSLKLFRSSSLKPSKARNSRYVTTEIRHTLQLQAGPRAPCCRLIVRQPHWYQAHSAVYHSSRRLRWAATASPFQFTVPHRSVNL